MIIKHGFMIGLTFQVLVSHLVLLSLELESLISLVRLGPGELILVSPHGFEVLDFFFPFESIPRSHDFTHR